MKLVHAERSPNLGRHLDHRHPLVRPRLQRLHHLGQRHRDPAGQRDQQVDLGRDLPEIRRDAGYIARTGQGSFGEELGCRQWSKAMVMDGKRIRRVLISRLYVISERIHDSSLDIEFYINSR